MKNRRRQKELYLEDIQPRQQKRQTETDRVLKLLDEIKRKEAYSHRRDSPEH